MIPRKIGRLADPPWERGQPGSWRVIVFSVMTSAARCRRPS